MYPDLTDLIQLFKHLVAKDFNFLFRDYSFRLVHEEEYSSGIGFRFESPKVALEISFIRHELGFRIGMKDLEEKEGLPVSIEDLVIIANHEPFCDLVYSEEGMIAWLGEIEAVLKSHGGPLLVGDSTAYRNLRESQRSRNESSMREMQLRDIREKLIHVWETRDYTAIVRLLHPMKQYLSSVELKKLEYAQKHIWSGHNG